MNIRSRDVLIVVDVQNDFCTGGALAVPGGEQVIAAIHSIAERFQHIVLTQDWHPSHHVSFASAHLGGKPYASIDVEHGTQMLWPDHCVQGTTGAALRADLLIPSAELILRKGFRQQIDSYSAFFENDRKTPTGLGGYLRERGLERVFLAGLAYDFCVGFSALDARRIGLPATVLFDGCRAIDEGNSVRDIESAFRTHGVQVARNGDLI